LLSHASHDSERQTADTTRAEIQTWGTLAADEKYQKLQQCPKKGVVCVQEDGTVSRKSGGNAMLVNVDIVTAFDQSTGHRSRYVLSSADEPATKQSITLQDGTSMASAIRLRLIEGGRAEDLQAAIKRSIEEPGAPQRLGSIEFGEDDRRCFTRSQELRRPPSLRASLLPGNLV
jgi:hypothetical protein